MSASKRERVPVLHGLAQARDPVSVGIERRHGLRHERPRKHRSADDREEACSEPRGCPAADRCEHDTEPEKRRESQRSC